MHYTIFIADAKSVLQKGDLILDQHILDINHLDSVTVRLQRILPHTFGKLGDSGDAVSCDPKPEQRSDCSSVSLQITEQDVPIPVPLPESKLLPIVDKPSNLHDTDTNSRNKDNNNLNSCSLLVIKKKYVKYLLGINGQEYLKTLGRNNHCFITVGDVSSKDSSVLLSSLTSQIIKKEKKRRIKVSYSTAEVFFHWQILNWIVCVKLSLPLEILVCVIQMLLYTYILLN